MTSDTTEVLFARHGPRYRWFAAGAVMPGTIRAMAGAMHFPGQVIHAQAYTMAFRDSFLIVALVFSLALFPAWIMGRTKTRYAR